MTGVVFGTSNRIRGLEQAEDFTFRFEEVPRVAQTSSVPGVLNDANYNLTSFENTANDFRVVVDTSLINTNAGAVIFRSLTPDIATVDDTGFVRVISPGGQIKISVTSGGVERVAQRQCYTSTSVYRKLITTYLANSLGKKLTDDMVAICARSTPQGNVTGLGGTQNRFASCNYDVNNPVVTANPTFFGRYGGDGVTPIDWSALSVINEHQGKGSCVHPPVLISPRHVLSARHFHPAVGTKVVFMRSDGSLQTETITASWQSIQAIDLWVGLLSNPITGIDPIQIMPAGWFDYMKSCITPGIGVVDPMGIATVFTKNVWTPDHRFNDRVSVTYISMLINQQEPHMVGVGPGNPTLAPLESWRAYIAGGDSGSPSMALIDNKLTLLCLYGSGGGGADVCAYASLLQTAMDNLAGAAAGTYTFARASLSGFTSYA